MRGLQRAEVAPRLACEHQFAQCAASVAAGAIVVGDQAALAVEHDACRVQHRLTAQRVAHAQVDREEPMDLLVGSQPVVGHGHTLVYTRCRQLPPPSSTTVPMNSAQPHISAASTAVSVHESAWVSDVRARLSIMNSGGAALDLKCCGQSFEGLLPAGSKRARGNSPIDHQVAIRHREQLAGEPR